MTDTKIGEGWAWPMNSKKAHFFGKDGRARCGRWLFFGQPVADRFASASPDDCRACRKKVEQENVRDARS